MLFLWQPKAYLYWSCEKRRTERETERHEGSPGLTGKKAFLSTSSLFHVASFTKIIGSLGHIILINQCSVWNLKVVKADSTLAMKAKVLKASVPNDFSQFLVSLCVALHHVYSIDLHSTRTCVWVQDGLWRGAFCRLRERRFAVLCVSWRVGGSTAGSMWACFL